MARHVAERLGAHPKLTAVVGGDFKVGETDIGKTGFKYAGDEIDGYDDTHALLAGGLTRGMRPGSPFRAGDVGESYDDAPADRLSNLAESQTRQERCAAAQTWPVRPTSPAANRHHRQSMSIALIRDLRVVGLRPSNSAAPPGPCTFPPATSRALLRLAFSSSRI